LPAGKALHDTFELTEELVQALLLRLSTALPAESARQRPAPVDVAELHVDIGARRVRVCDREIVLTVMEFNLLRILLERRELAVSRDDLLADVWGLSVRTRTRTVDTHVKRLRDKLGSAGKFIQTVRGVGYRFSEEPAPEGDLEGEGE
jgi:two-component system phosphate regulon response regulator PhoB